MSSKRARFFKHTLYLLFDVFAVFGIAVLVALVCNATIQTHLSLSNLWFPSLLIATLMPLGNLAVGLYESKVRESIRAVFRRVVISGAISFGVIFTLGYLFVNMSFPMEFVALTIALVVVMHTLWRFWAIFHGGLNLAKRNVMIVGTGKRAAFIAQRMRRDSDREHFNLLGFLPMTSLKDVHPLIAGEEHVIPICTDDDWSSTLFHCGADVIVLANDRQDPLPMTALLKQKMAGAEIVEMEDFVEAELGLLEVESMRPEWLLNSSGFHFNRYGNGFINYGFNALLSLLLLFFTWPIMLLAILAIYLEEGFKLSAPVIYRQQRVGLDGKLFEIMKFRSMRSDAEVDGAQWATKNDARVTRVGRVLRKYRIDELPQLLNVLRGDMGFVGPRPERPEFVERLEKDIPFFNYRHCVNPGLTGWAQLKYPYGASENDSLEKLKFDLYYIKHRSFLLDVFVLVRTVEIVLFGRGR
jgi:sugar transferase (PEP-CTERM system associated)